MQISRVCSCNSTEFVSTISRVRKTKVGGKLLRFPPTRFLLLTNPLLYENLLYGTVCETDDVDTTLQLVLSLSVHGINGIWDVLH